MKSGCMWNRKLQLGFGAAILTLLGAAVISYRAMVSSSQSQAWLRHTDQVLEELQELLSASQNIESTNRGFALTGDKSYIESFRANILREAKPERSIEELTADTLVQQRRVPVVSSLQKRSRPEELLRVTALSGRQEEQGMRVRKDGSRLLAISLLPLCATETVIYK